MSLFNHEFSPRLVLVALLLLVFAQPGFSQIADMSEPASGERDESGYRWVSDETNSELSFAWIDVSDEGKEVIYKAGRSLPIQLPFEFPFLGEVQDRIALYEGILVGFGSDGESVSGFNGDNLNSFLSPLGESVKASAERVYSYYDKENELFVIQFDGVRTAPGDGNASGLQLILFEDGRILIQYAGFEPGVEVLAEIFKSDRSRGMRIRLGDRLAGRFAVGITLAEEWDPVILDGAGSDQTGGVGSFSTELVELPFFDSFPVSGVSFPNWINSNGAVNNTGGASVPSLPFTLNLNADPTGSDQVTLENTNLAGQQGAGLVFVYSFKPGDDTNGENPDLGEFLVLEFKNNLGAWIEVRSYEGYGFGGPPPQYLTYQRDIVDIGAEPAGGGTFFHSTFQARFRSNGSTGPFDDWFVDDVFIGTPENLTVTPRVIVDTLILGNTSDRSFQITNNDGSVGALNFTVVDPNQPWMLPPFPQSGSIPPLQSQQINFTLNANVLPGTYNAKIFVNGTPGNQKDTVFVTLVVKDRPIIRVEPDTVYANLSPDLVDTSSFTIFNDGGGALTVFSIQNEEITGSLSPLEYLTILDENGKVIGAPEGGDDPLLGSGGPDLFGYSWTDSDEPGGPIYSFNDISQTGTPLTLTASPGSPSALNEGYSVVNLPFSIKFYSQTLSQLVVHSNGFVVLDGAWRPAGGSAELPPNSMPALALPNAVMAPLWNDLDGSPNGGQIFTKTIGDQFIIQYDNWSNRTATGDTLTFQIIFFKESRSVLFQYSEFQNSFQNYIVGMENSSGDDGLLIAPKFSNYLHEALTVQISKEALWLTENPGSAVIPPGSSMDFDLIFDTDGLPFGTYEASLIIFNDDPFNGIVKSPNIVMLITAPPDISLSETTLNYGTIFINETGKDTVTVTNNGGAVLNVTSVTSDNPDFSPVPASFNLNIGASQDVIVTLIPSGAGITSGTLTLNSNDPDEPAATVALTATVSDLPNLSVVPESVNERFKIGTGSSNSQLIALTNTGGATISYSFPDFVIVEGTGGTDSFGHRWIDSDQPGGPEFEWLDIRSVGTSISLGNNSSVNVPLPFSFSFYGQSKDTVTVSSNGYLTFGTSGTVSLNTNLPNTNPPNDVIAPFWDDLDPSQGGTIHHYFDPSRNRFIVQFTDVPHINGSIGGPYTFQAILGIDESITFQYLDVTINSPSNTVGIENQSGTDGLQVAHNTSYVHDSLSVLISENNNGVWLGVTPVSGSLASGVTSNVEVSFSDPGLAGGLYLANLLVNSNDPDEPQRGIPVTLQINRPSVRDKVITDLVIAEDQGSVVTALLDSIFSDIDLDPLSYTLQVSGVSVTASTSGDTLIVATLQDAFGSNTIIVTADDGQYTVTDTFSVTVNPINDAPVLALPDVNFAEDDSLTVSLNAFVSDVDHDTTEITFGSTVLSAALESTYNGLSVSASRRGVGPAVVNAGLNEAGEWVAEVGNGDLLITIDNLTNRATFKASADSFGVFDVEFTATDDSGAVTRDTVEVAVTPVNDPPFRISSIPDQTYPEDSGTHLIVGNLNTVFDDIDNVVLAFGTTVSEDGLIASVTGNTLEVTTVANAFGSFSITVSASDSQYTVRDTFDVVITPVNDAPTVVGPLQDNVVGEDFGSIIFADLDTVFQEIDPGDQLAFVASAQNGLLSVDVTGSVLTLTSVIDLIGLESVVVSATDDSGAVVSDTFVVDIRNLNDGPTVVKPVSNLVVAEDFADFVAADLDTVFNDIDPGDNLGYSVVVISGNLVAQINGSELELSSIADLIGNETIIVTAVDDSGATVSDTVLVSIFNLNDAPVVAVPIGDLILPEDFSTFDHADLTTVFQDIDPGDNLSFSVAATNGFLTASVVAGNLRLSSIADQIGIETVIVTATDDSAAAVRDTFFVDIRNLNDGPTVASPVSDLVVAEDFAGFVAADLDTVFNDIDPGDNLAYSVALINGNLVAQINGSNLELSSIADVIGNETVIVTAVDDSGAAVSDTILVSIFNLNDAPVVSQPIGDLILAEDFAAFDYANLMSVFQDIDPGDNLAFSVSVSSGLLTASVVGGDLRLSSIADLIGIETVIVTATDDSAAAVSDTFEVTIVNLNDAPVVNSPMPDVALAEDFGPFVAADLDTVFNDIDPGDQLSFSAVASGGLLTPDISAGVLSLIAVPDANGLETVIVTATDDSGAFVSDTLLVAIAPLNDAPVVAASIGNVVLDEDFPQTTVASLDTVFSDVDAGDQLAYVVSVKNGLLTAAIVGELVNLGSLPDLIGNDSVFVTATDDSGASVVAGFLVTINNVNDAPTNIAALPDVNVNEDFSDFDFADLDTVFFDIDPGDNLTYSLQFLNSLADGSVTGSTLTLSSVPDAQGIETVIVTATDNSLASVADTFDVNISNLNDNPFVASAIPDVVLSEDFGTITVASLESVFADIDPGDMLAFGVSVVSGFLSVSLNGTDLELTSLADVVGVETVIVTATDDSGATVADTFSVTVQNLNDAPVVSVNIADLTVSEDFGTFIYADLDTIFADIDPGDQLSFAGGVEGGLLDVAIDGSGLRLTSVSDEAGVETVIVTATDDSGAAVSDTFQVTISNLNDAPVVSSPISDAVVAEDFQNFPVIDLANVFDDADPGDNALYSVALSGGLLQAIVAGSDLTLSSVQDAFGVETVIVTATDDSGAAASDTFVVTINQINDPPVVANAISDQSISEETQNYFVAVLSTTFSDVDGNLSVFAVSSGDNVVGSVAGDSLFVSAILDFVGLDTLTVTALDDSGAGVSDVFVVTVTNLNDPPFVVQPISDLAIPEDKQDFFVAALNSVFQDVDGNLTSFAVSSNGNVLGNFNITNDSLFISASLNFLGFDTLTVMATDDSGASAIDVFVVEVTNLNFAPVVQNAISDQIIPEDSDDLFVADLLDVFFDIDDGDSLRFVVTSQDGNVTGSIVNDALFLDAGPDFIGSDFLIVTATDDSGATVADSFVVDVENVNDPPFVASAISDLVLDEDFASIVIAVLDTVFGDIDPLDSLSFSVQVVGGAVSASVQGNGLVLDPVSNAFGMATVIVTAEDIEFSTARDTVQVTVSNVNDAPVLSGIPDLSFDEDNSTALFLNPFVQDVDNDSSEIRFTAEVIDATAEAAATIGTRKTVRLDAGMKQRVSIDLRKKGRSGLDEDSKNPTKTAPIGSNLVQDSVTPVERLLAGPAASIVKTGRLNRSGLEYSVGMLGRQLVLEVGPGDLVISIDTVTNVATFSTTQDSSGAFTVVFEAADPDGLSDTDTILVVVLPVNDAPMIVSPIDDVVVDEDFGSTLIADLRTVFVDLESDSLAFAAVVSGTGVSTQLAGDSLFLTSTPDFNGTVTLVVTATDEGGLSVSDSAVITVSPVNDAPLAFGLILPADGDTLASLSDPVAFAWHPSSDVDGDTLTYSLVLSAAGFDTVIGGLADTTMLLDPTILEFGTNYDWSVFVSDGSVAVASPDTFHFVTPDSVVGIDDRLADIPEKFKLHPNYPNPFNPSTIIRFDLPKDSRVVLKVYNLIGQEVATLVNGFEKAGYRSVVWDGKNRFGRQVSSGLYIYRIEAAEFVQTMKMMLVR